MKPEELLPKVYDDLRKLAAARLSDENSGQTLSATGLVHEAWLKLAGAPVEWLDRTHFFRAAATAMRRILVDRARAKLTEKRGKGPQRVDLFPEIPSPLPAPELIRLDEALNRLAQAKPDHAKLVDLRFFCGMSGDEAAETMGISPSTADRMWRYARAYLKVEME